MNAGTHIVARFGSPQGRTGRFAAGIVMAAALAASSRADQVNPDSAGNTRESPNTYITVRPRQVGTPISIYFTHNGYRIRNQDNSEPHWARRSLPGDGARFFIPGTINGQSVTDTEVETGVPTDPLDPGILQATVFTPGGIMIANSIGGWLCSNGYGPAAPMTAPEFLSTTSPVLYYSVNLADLGAGGAAFVAATPPGAAFVIGADGKIPGLPAYTFNLAPFVYIPGVGWVATGPAPAGMVITYEGSMTYEGDCCYANCDQSAVLPILNVNDFVCFLNRFATNDSYADCDRNGAFNVNDLVCFVNQFAVGCP
jgi:hypothetical protein